jgi:hypothetical protein
MCRIDKRGARHADCGGVLKNKWRSLEHDTLSPRHQDTPTIRSNGRHKMAQHVVVNPAKDSI